MRYLILSVPLSLLVSKENRGPHFIQQLFFLISISLNITYLVCICICLCILAVNLMSRRGTAILIVIFIVLCRRVRVKFSKSCIQDFGLQKS